MLINMPPPIPTGTGIYFLIFEYDNLIYLIHSDIPINGIIEGDRIKFKTDKEDCFVSKDYKTWESINANKNFISKNLKIIFSTDNVIAEDKAIIIQETVSPYIIEFTDFSRDLKIGQIIDLNEVTSVEDKNSFACCNFSTSDSNVCYIDNERKQLTALEVGTCNLKATSTWFYRTDIKLAYDYKEGGGK